MKRLFAVATACAVLGSGVAHAQTYFQLMDACKNVSQKPADRIKSCDAAFAAAQPDAKADRATILLNRSDGYLNDKKLDAAIADADAAGKLLPRFLQAENARCWTRGVANKDVKEARLACNIALDISNKDAGVWDSSGLIGLRLGEWQKAWYDYDQAYTLNKNQIGSRYGRGLALIGLGKSAEGEADLKAAASAKAEFDSYGLKPESVKKRAAETPTPATPAN
jgi:tetratricopeptide (TPR) repeat protein